MPPSLRRETIPAPLFVLLGVAQHLQDALGEMLVDFGVSWNGLGYLRGGVVIPVVLPAVANKHAATRFELPD